MKKLSLAAICAVVFVFVVALSVLAQAAPGLVVLPPEHNFGEVELGSSSSTIITITNDWFDTLIIDIGFQPGSSPDFSIASEPLPDTIGPFESADIQITFSPSAIGFVEAALIVAWANGESGTTVVPLAGVGVDATGEPVTIDDILAFFDASIEDRTLLGVGPGNSDEAHISVMRHVLRLVARLISNNKVGVACKHLEFVYARCDENFPPPDFVEGPAASELAEMIEALMTELGCL